MIIIYRYLFIIVNVHTDDDDDGNHHLLIVGNGYIDIWVNSASKVDLGFYLMDERIFWSGDV